MPLENPEWSIELDPRTLSAEWGEVLGWIGVHYASLGVQTFDPVLQAAIGRIQPDADIVRAVDLLRDNGVSSLNFDLMYGLPGQRLFELEATLERSVQLEPDRIALFGYAHVPHLLPCQRRIDGSALPDQTARFEMAEFGYRLLTAAIGCYPDLLVQNEKNAGRYRMSLSQDLLPASGGVRRSPDDQRRGAVIEALLCYGKTSLDADLAAEAVARLAPCTARGLAVLEGEVLAIAPGALPYARTIAALFDPYRQNSLHRFSSAV